MLSIESIDRRPLGRVHRRDCGRDSNTCEDLQPSAENRVERNAPLARLLIQRLNVMPARTNDRPIDRQYQLLLRAWLDQTVVARMLPKKVGVSLQTLHRAACGLAVQDCSARTIEDFCQTAVARGTF